jgi:hypothetical protein
MLPSAGKGEHCPSQRAGDPGKETGSCVGQGKSSQKFQKEAGPRAGGTVDMEPRLRVAGSEGEPRAPGPIPSLLSCPGHPSPWRQYRASVKSPGVAVSCLPHALFVHIYKHTHVCHLILRGTTWYFKPAKKRNICFSSLLCNPHTP